MPEDWRALERARLKADPTIPRCAWQCQHGPNHASPMGPPPLHGNPYPTPVVLRGSTVVRLFTTNGVA